MFANDFEYHRADAVEEAIDLLVEHDGAELVAGAHGLLPRMRTGEESPPALVDIGRIDGLSSIDGTDGELSIGALVTHATVADSEPVRAHAPALSDAAGEVGDLQVRNGGTVGGNLAHGDARADLPAAALALEGELVVRGPDGERTIDADDVFVDHFETAVADNEIVTALRLPVTDDETVSAYRKRRNPLSGYALVGVAVRAHLGAAGEAVRDARVAVTGATTRPRRLREVEDELAGAQITAEAISEAASLARTSLDDDEFRTDPQTSAAYRAHLLGIETERALRSVLKPDDD
jgi:aerobic carbon-monoxide dehydrogenase medium subunit